MTDSSDSKVFLIISATGCYPSLHVSSVMLKTASTMVQAWLTELQCSLIEPTTKLNIILHVTNYGFDQTGH